jgi:hypothetical protein
MVFGVKAWMAFSAATFIMPLYPRTHAGRKKARDFPVIFAIPFHCQQVKVRNQPVGRQGLVAIFFKTVQADLKNCIAIL